MLGVQSFSVLTSCRAPVADRLVDVARSDAVNVVLPAARCTMHATSAGLSVIADRCARACSLVSLRRALPDDPRCAHGATPSAATSSAENAAYPSAGIHRASSWHAARPVSYAAGGINRCAISW